MITILIELAIVGLFFVLIFFTKLSSVPAPLKAVIIGVRGILLMGAIGGIGYLAKSWYEKMEEKTVLANELQKFSPEGQWFFNNGRDHILILEADSSFTDSYKSAYGDTGDYGRYIIYKNSDYTYLKLDYSTKTKVFQIIKIDGQEVSLLEDVNGKEGQNIKMIRR